MGHVRALDEGTPGPRLVAWAEDQRALARALGLSIEEWLAELDGAAERKTGLTAAVVGAAVSQGLGLEVLDSLDGPSLAARARALIDPRPPRVESPILAEAIRRADELGAGSGAGARRLKQSRTRADVPVPDREARPIGPSADQGTADAPGAPEDAAGEDPP